MGWVPNSITGTIKKSSVFKLPTEKKQSFFKNYWLSYESLFKVSTGKELFYKQDEKYSNLLKLKKCKRSGDFPRIVWLKNKSFSYKFSKKTSNVHESEENKVKHARPKHPHKQNHKLTIFIFTLHNALISYNLIYECNKN